VIYLAALRAIRSHARRASSASVVPVAAAAVSYRARSPSVSRTGTCRERRSDGGTGGRPRLGALTGSLAGGYGG
jgi:hypothetical protein